MNTDANLLGIVQCLVQFDWSIRILQIRESIESMSLNPVLILTETT